MLKISPLSKRRLLISAFTIFLTLMHNSNFFWSSFCYAAQSPDLTIEWYPHLTPKGIYPWPPLVDRSTIFSVRIKNDGKAAVDKKFNTKVFVDGNLMKTEQFPSTAEISDLGLNASILLKPGSTRVYDYEETFAQGGKHHIVWIVDDDNKIKESDESNNKISATIILQEPPDLIVEDIWPDYGTPLGGQKAKWMIKVTNIGKGNIIAPFMTAFRPEVPGGAHENFWVQSLAAGQSVIFDTTQDFKSWGNKTLRAEADVGNSIPEALPDGETNNELAKTFDLRQVDLEVKNVEITPKKPVAHSPLTIAFDVNNKGTGDATHPFEVEIFPGKVTPGLMSPYAMSVNGLGAGESKSLKHTITLPPGRIRSSIFVDSGNLYLEPDSKNNVHIAYIGAPGVPMSNNPNHELGVYSLYEYGNQWKSPVSPYDNLGDLAGYHADPAGAFWDIMSGLATDKYAHQESKRIINQQMTYHTVFPVQGSSAKNWDEFDMVFFYGHNNMITVKDDTDKAEVWTNKSGSWEKDKSGKRYFDWGTTNLPYEYYPKDVVTGVSHPGAVVYLYEPHTSALLGYHFQPSQLSTYQLKAQDKPDENSPGTTGTFTSGLGTNDLDWLILHGCQAVIVANRQGSQYDNMGVEAYKKTYDGFHIILGHYRSYTVGYLTDLSSFAFDLLAGMPVQAAYFLTDPNHNSSAISAECYDSTLSEADFLQNHSYMNTETWINPKPGTKDCLSSSGGSKRIWYSKWIQSLGKEAENWQQ